MFFRFRRLLRIEAELQELRYSIAELVDAVRYLTATTRRTGTRIMADLTALAAEIEENGDAVDSAIVLLDSLADRLDDAAGDPEAVAALAEEIRTDRQALADAVARNTPADPGPVDEEPVDEEPVDVPVDEVPPEDPGA